MTLRQLFYRLVSAGALENQQAQYKRLGTALTRLREAGTVPRDWIVDHLRDTLKPASWTDLAAFVGVLHSSYRKDYWAGLDCHVEVVIEKDALAATIEAVGEEFDVPIRVVRGYCSASYAFAIAERWRRLRKPIFVYYLGDFDPSGFDLERDLQEKLARYSGKRPARPGEKVSPRAFRWTRLAVRYEDFAAFNLVRLPVKQSDKRAKNFVAQWGDDCAEIDALPPEEIRRRVREAIESHIDAERWRQLQQVESTERDTLQRLLAAFGN